MNFQDFWGDFHMCRVCVSFRGRYIAFTFGERPMSLHFEFQVGDLSQTRTMGRIFLNMFCHLHQTTTIFGDGWSKLKRMKGVGFCQGISCQHLMGCQPHEVLEKFSPPAIENGQQAKPQANNGFRGMLTSGMKQGSRSGDLGTLGSWLRGSLAALKQVCNQRTLVFRHGQSQW